MAVLWLLRFRCMVVLIIGRGRRLGGDALLSLGSSIRVQCDVNRRCNVLGGALTSHSLLILFAVGCLPRLPRLACLASPPVPACVRACLPACLLCLTASLTQVQARG